MRAVLARLAALFVFVLGLVVIRNQLVFVLLAATAFIGAERVWAFRAQPILRRGWATDLVYMVGNIPVVGVLVLIVLIPGTAVLRVLIPSGFRSTVSGLPFAAQFFPALLVGAICGYWTHRAAHQVPALWRFHKVHHSIVEMDWLTGFRFHPFDQAFLRLPAAIVIYSLGFSNAVLVSVFVVHGFFSIFFHSNIRVKLGPLRWVVASPDFHHWHHALDSARAQCNYAGESPLVDALFGTLYLPRNERPVEYGIDAGCSGDYAHQVAWPFARRAKATSA